MIIIKKLYLLFVALLICIFGFNIKVKAGGGGGGGSSHIKFNFYDGYYKQYTAPPGTSFLSNDIFDIIDDMYSNLSFEGFYLDSNYENLWSSQLFPAVEIVLDIYVKFQPATINFYGLHGLFLQSNSILIDNWDNLNYPDVSDFDGYSFVGWDKDLTQLEFGNHDIFAIYEDNRSVNIINTVSDSFIDLIKNVCTGIGAVFASQFLIVESGVVHGISTFGIWFLVLFGLGLSLFVLVWIFDNFRKGM